MLNWRSRATFDVTGRVSFSRALALAFAILVAIGASTPARAADPDNGQRLAHRWCEACHVVSPAQTRPAADQAPPFATIAASPKFDAGAVALFLLNPHPKMPDMSLTRLEAADLAAYIATLKP